MKIRVDLFLVMAVLVLLTQPAHAYLDSNSSAYISQLFLGGLAGWILLGRLFCSRLVTLFSRRKESGTPAR